MELDTLISASLSPRSLAIAVKNDFFIFLFIFVVFFFLFFFLFRMNFDGIFHQIIRGLPLLGQSSLDVMRHFLSAS